MPQTCQVVLDGEELNNVDMSAPNLTRARIPTAMSKRVEVMYGPSPVLYGDNFVAGVECHDRYSRL